MKNTKYILAGLLALGSMASAAHAITVAASDLVLGFSRTSGTGSTNSLEIVLGSVASLSSLSNGSEYSLSSVVKLADIQNFGSGTTWQNTQTSWAVVGATDVGDNLVWGTVKSGQIAGNPGANQGTVSNNIQSLYTAQAGGLAAEVATANSDSAAWVSNAGANAWKSKLTTSSNFGYSPWSGKLTQTTASLGSTSFQASDLYSFAQGGEAGSATLLGTFKLYNDGNFTFTSFTAIPEPSTYAAILGIATLGFAAIRRRKQAQQLV